MKIAVLGEKNFNNYLSFIKIIDYILEDADIFQAQFVSNKYYAYNEEKDHLMGIAFLLKKYCSFKNKKLEIREFSWAEAKNYQELNQKSHHFFLEVDFFIFLYDQNSIKHNEWFSIIAKDKKIPYLALDLRNQ